MFMRNVQEFAGQRSVPAEKVQKTDFSTQRCNWTGLPKIALSSCAKLNASITRINVKCFMLILCFHLAKNSSRMGAMAFGAMLWV